MFDRLEGLRVGRDQEAARVAAVAKADAWTLGQAARLEVMPKEILATIRCGWLPEQIATVSSKYHLEDNPPLPNGVPSWHDQEIDRKALAKNRRDRARGETSMSAAFKQAAE